MAPVVLLILLIAHYSVMYDDCCKFMFLLHHVSSVHFRMFYTIFYVSATVLYIVNTCVWHAYWLTDDGDDDENAECSLVLFREFCAKYGNYIIKSKHNSFDAATVYLIDSCVK